MKPAAPHPPPFAQEYRIVALTYELSDAGVWVPVVRHEFYGNTPERALRVWGAHLETDSFLRECTQNERFGDITCHTVLYPVERIGG